MSKKESPKIMTGAKATLMINERPVAFCNSLSVGYSTEEVKKINQQASRIVRAKPVKVEATLVKADFEKLKQQFYDSIAGKAFKTPIIEDKKESEKVGKSLADALSKQSKKVLDGK